ncbi:hypothetical protein [Frigoribacterium sp. CFBP 13712]|uniref:hypothetical protein n=1 Tax=Frigoribacterium sp. CFBP 13712 TaxID=2775309 RepID=UPI00177F9801|nr:hypothetical protein [Frigoribacterium sp. CFBP 13712]MBD8702731.1 hypothetical protein [Frigoribacterium sp. CFBP 13712]
MVPSFSQPGTLSAHPVPRAGTAPPRRAFLSAGVAPPRLLSPRLLGPGQASTASR